MRQGAVQFQSPAQSFAAFTAEAPCRPDVRQTRGTQPRASTRRNAQPASTLQTAMKCCEQDTHPNTLFHKTCSGRQRCSVRPKKKTFRTKSGFTEHNCKSRRLRCMTISDSARAPMEAKAGREGDCSAGGGGGRWDGSPFLQPPPCVRFRRVVVSLRGPGQSAVLPFGCCVGSLRSVGRCGRCSCWCRFRVGGAQWLAFSGCVGCCGGRFSLLAAHSPPHSGRPRRASLRFHGLVCWVAPSSLAAVPEGGGGGLGAGGSPTCRAGGGGHTWLNVIPTWR